MIYYGSQKWIPFGTQELVASADACMIKLMMSHFLMSTQMSMQVVSDHVCGNICLFVMMIYGGDPRCEPLWCEPIGSWFEMMDVMRYLYWFCLYVCLSTDLACQMVMMVTLVVQNL